MAHDEKMFGLLLPLLLCSGSAGQWPIELTADGHFQQVSVGVYDAAGSLVKTLVRCQEWNAGSHRLSWDGLAEDGLPATGGPFQLKVLSGNLTGKWVGALDDPSRYGSSSFTLQGYGGFLGFQAVGDKLLIERTYNEGPEFFDEVANDQPNVFRQVGHEALEPFGPFYIPTCVTSNGKTLYLGFAPSGMNATEYGNAGIAALRVQGNRSIRWPSIAPIPGVKTGQNGAGRLLCLTDSRGASIAPTSMDIQPGGTLLAVAQRDLGRVVLVDSVKGMLIDSPAIPCPNVACVRWSADGSGLWVASGNGVTRWNRSSNFWKRGTTIQGPDLVRAMAVDSKSGSLAVAYGGASNQVFLYSPLGAERERLGVAGGYRNGPEVSDFKWGFAPPGFNAGYGEGLAFDSRGELWVNDPLNYRAVRIDLAKRLVDARLSHLSNIYRLAVDQNAPERLFVGTLEFRRNWKLPPSAPGACTLMRNWSTDGMGGFQQVVTAKNGRTYAVTSPTPGTNAAHLWELAANGARMVSDRFPYEFLDRDMSVWWSSADRAIGQVNRAALDGFDGNGDPSWGPAEVYAHPPKLLGDPFSEGGVPSGAGQVWQATPSGDLICVSHQTDAKPRQWFYGLVPKGGSSYLVKAAPGDARIPLPYPREATVPVGGPYTISGAQTRGDLTWILAGGEGWNSGEASQILLYHSSGLPVWQGGVANIPDSYVGGNGRAGNPYGNALVESDDKVIHLVMTAEANNGPQEWRFENADSLHLVAAPLDERGTSIHLNGGGRKGSDRLSPLFEDDFSRPSGGMIGRGWLDPDHNWLLRGHRLELHGHHFADEAKSVLLRPDAITNSVQELAIPDSFGRPERLYLTPTNAFGNWGLVARRQASGRLLRATVWYSRGSTVRLSLAVDDGEGRLWTIDASNQSAPPPVGRHYVLRMTTFGSSPTRVSADLVDQTLGKVWMHVEGVTDEPGLQGTGQCGLFTGFSRVQVAGYRLSTIARDPE